jgi:hypothetical protein
VEVHRSARKHGVADADVRHAVAHHLHELELGEDAPWRVLYLGPDRAGNMLEIITIERHDGSELAIHALKMRWRYEQLLP